MSDLRLLAWLRWRQWRGSALYWLRTLGYDPNQRTLIDRAYALYLLALGILWVAAMGAYAFTQAASLGRALPPALLASALSDGLPWLALILQVLALVWALRATPLKLSFADMAYVAGSPVSRRAAVLVNFGQVIIQALLVLAPLMALLVVVIAQPLGPAIERGAALRAGLVVLPLAVLALGFAWSAGLIYLATPRLRHLPAFWLAPVLLLPCAYLVPEAGLWPGRVLAAAVAGSIPWGAVLVLAALALAAVVLLARISRRTNMVDVADESAVYARINALGLMAVLAPDVVNRIRRQASLARRKPFLHLPTARGDWTLFGRAALGYVRHPQSLLMLAAWGFVVTVAASQMVSGQVGILVWLFGLTAFLLIPPPGLLDAYRADTREPFLRQLLPADNLRLLIADIAPSEAALLLGALVAWLWQGMGPVTTLAGVLLIAIIACVLGLCQGASLVVTLFWGQRIPYAVWGALSVGGIAWIGMGTGSLLSACFAGLFALVVLSAAVAGSPAIISTS